MMIDKLVITMTFLLMFIVLPHQALNSDLKFFLVNSKGLDYKFAGKADAHRFGVELKENKQFHHTITAEDGVRLGCYGFELENKKYSTNYIADGKGYRLAPTTTDLITVYSKGSSEPRIASFIESFNEEEIKAANIRYLFPDGCAAPKLLYDPNNPSTQYENRRKLFESLIENHQKAKIDEINKNKADKSATLKEALKTGEDADEFNKNGNQNNNDNNKNNKNNNRNSNNNNSNNNGNNNGSNNGNLNDDKNNKNSNRFNTENGNKQLNNPNGYVYENPNTNFQTSNFDCCSIDRVQFLMPQNDSCSKNTAKLIIPISSEKLSTISMSDFANIQLSSSVSFVLKELLYLVEKYNL